MCLVFYCLVITFFPLAPLNSTLQYMRAEPVLQIRTGQVSRSDGFLLLENTPTESPWQSKTNTVFQHSIVQLALYLNSLICIYQYPHSVLLQLYLHSSSNKEAASHQLISWWQVLRACEKTSSHVWSQVRMTRSGDSSQQLACWVVCLAHFEKKINIWLLWRKAAHILC